MFSSTYNELEYTTALPELTDAAIRKADRLAREIHNEGHHDEEQMDRSEEEMFSQVSRNPQDNTNQKTNNLNKYKYSNEKSIPSQNQTTDTQIDKSHSELPEWRRDRSAQKDTDLEMEISSGHSGFNKGTPTLSGTDVQNQMEVKNQANPNPPKQRNSKPSKKSDPKNNWEDRTQAKEEYKKFSDKISSHHLLSSSQSIDPTLEIDLSKNTPIKCTEAVPNKKVNETTLTQCKSDKTQKKNSVPQNEKEKKLSMNAKSELESHMHTKSSSELISTSSELKLLNTDEADIQDIDTLDMNLRKLTPKTNSDASKSLLITPTIISACELSTTQESFNKSHDISSMQDTSTESADKHIAGKQLNPKAEVFHFDMARLEVEEDNQPANQQNQQNDTTQQEGLNRKSYNPSGTSQIKNFSAFPLDSNRNQNHSPKNTRVGVRNNTNRIRPTDNSPSQQTMPSVRTRSSPGIQNDGSGQQQYSNKTKPSGKKKAPLVLYLFSMYFLSINYMTSW